jgi:Protein of unknown function (DUF3040)
MLEVTVPLSEEEQRLLAELEQALADEDPKFASTLRGSSMRSRQRRLAIVAAAGFALGVILLMAGVIIPLTAVSIAGFVLMLGSAYVGLMAWRKSNQPEPLRVVGSEAPRRGGKKPGKHPGKQQPRSTGSTPFMARMEERWRRRRESGF